MIREVERETGGHRKSRNCKDVRNGAKIGMVTLVCLAAVVPTQANQAGDILQQVGATYRNAKTFQARAVQRQSGKTPQGQTFTLTTNQQIRYKAPNLFAIQISVQGTGAASKANGSQVVVSDGKNLFLYVPALKKYQKRPIPPSVPLPSLFALLRLAIIPQAQVPNATLLPAATVGGHPAYAILVKPTLRGNLTAAQRAQAQAALKQAKPIRVMVEKNSNTVLSMDQTMGSVDVHVMMSGQQVNGTVDSSAFTFAPPAGVTEAPSAPPPGAGGVPGRTR